MSELGDLATGAPDRSRTVLVSFLGAVVRRMGDWTPIAGTVDLMVQAGLDSSSVRTAVFRLKKRGWLSPRPAVDDVATPSPAPRSTPSSPVTR